MTEKTVTLAELAETYGRKYDTIWRKAKRTFPGEAWTANSAVTEDVARILIGDVPAPRPAVSAKPKPRTWTPESGPNGKAFREALPEIQKEFSNQPAPANEAIPPAPGRAKFTLPSFHAVRRFVFEVLAIAIVSGHGYMIWQEAAELYGYIGGIGGQIVFASACLALLIASDSSRARTSESALWFMLCVDVAAVFVHYEALHTLSVPKAMTIGFCLFISACSFVALLLYRDSKLD